MYYYLLSTTIFLILNLISAQDIGQNLNNNAQLEQFLNQQQSQISIDFPSSLNNGLVYKNSRKKISFKLNFRNLPSQQQLVIPQTIKSADKTSIFPSSQLPFDGVPPGFETVLPIEVLQKLRELHKNTNIPLTQKQSEFDKIMTSVSPKLLAKLPLPPGFEALPSNIKEKIKEINGDSSIDWSKKHLKVKELIGTLPQQQHPHPQLHNPIRIPSTQIQQTNSGNVIPEFFPPNPPPGFEKVLPPEVYQQLLQIHRSPQLTVQQKSLQIDQIMRSLPQNIIDSLPLPPGNFLN
ncbi:unnamed protein product [Meloidogyne enterolobii]|uniref:Uncharacterized protein n=1 Tax=Meloidogyne enterolobii TaxID=390850 RepID=A0ACB0YXY0_MELEN